MGFLKKYAPYIIVLAILLTFFISRFSAILNLPIFTDEAIYLRWAQIAKNDANWRFISLTDGKQPSFVWLSMIAMRFFTDPLLAGRIVSVFAGFSTLIGLFFLTKELFKNTRIALLTSFLYVVYPMALVYDRIALYDGLVGSFAVWALYLAILLARKIRLDIALILGMLSGGAVLTKTNGFFTLYLLPFSLLLFDWTKGKITSRFIKWVLLVILAALLANGFYAILRLSPFFHIIEEKNALFVYPPGEWIKHPFTYFVGNWSAQVNWVVLYMTLPVLFFTFLSFVRKEFIAEKALLAIWFIVPFTALAFFGNTIYPRFIFFMTLSLLPLAAYALYLLPQLIPFGLFQRKALLAFICILFFALQLRADYYILRDFAHAPIPVSDVAQYFTAWPSGVGVKESVSFFKEQAIDKKIYIATQGTFGLMPASLELYLSDNPNVTIAGYWPTSETVPQDIVEKSMEMPTYVVFYQACLVCEEKGKAPGGWKGITPVLQFQKVEYGSFYTVYQVSPY